jgi:two-component system NtrC family sensor kinase
MSQAPTPIGYQYPPKSCGVIRWINRLSLRARLIIAFFTLIVVSASITVVIAGAVFGQKISGLATSEMEVGLNMAEFYLSQRLKRVQTLTNLEAARLGTPGGSTNLCRGPWVKDGGIDLLLVIRVGDARGYHLRSRCTQVPIKRQALDHSELGDLIRQTEKQHSTKAGFLALKARTLRAIGIRKPPKEGLLMAVATPLARKGVLVLGVLLNGRREYVVDPLRRLKTLQRKSYEATIFLRDIRITTTLKRGSLGSHADRAVYRQVLQRGKRYVGTANVIGDDYYTAYMPLRNHNGIPVGIFGIGAKKQMYTDMRNTTTLLFGLLIAVGMLFGFITSYIFASWLIRPVTSIAEGMNRVACGDFNHKVRVESAQELGRLVKSFNMMVTQIKNREIRLKQITEERMSQVEKHVSIGRLAAGIAHEINNPLTSVLSLSMLIKRKTAPDDPVFEDLEIIVEESTRCRNIVRDLLYYARERPMETQTLDINQVIHETLGLTSRYEAMDDIQTVLDLTEEPLWVQGDDIRLQQVFTNVILNAAEAADGQGTIHIITDEDSSGGYAVIQVKDTGEGMDPETLKLAFEPFFTTKGPGQGTGLGLSVSLGIVRDHNGSIEIESREDQGVTVTIQLPRVTDETRNVDD